jgi:ferredoxin
MAGPGRSTSAGGAPAEDVVDRDDCMGSRSCVFWGAPGVFDLDDEIAAAAVVGDAAGHYEDVRRAAANCPTSAIRLDLLVPS